jgi:hypothetical protein
MEPVAQARIVDHGCSLRHVTHDRTPVWIKMIVALMRVVMLVKRLDLILGSPRIAALAVRIRWDQKGDGNGGK